jgi:hypothetical protein
MDNRKWLKRKYSDTFEKVNIFLDKTALIEFKKRKYKLGILTKDIIQVQKYKAGNLIMFKRSNPVNDENYPLHYAIIKCDKGFTQSGYHSFWINEDDFEEIIK